MQSDAGPRGEGAGDVNHGGEPGQDSSLSTVEAALDHARRGWRIFPLIPGEKRPLPRAWEKVATVDLRKIAEHWPRRANVGVACGPSGLVVIDLDTAAHQTAMPPEWVSQGCQDGADVLCVLAEEHRAPFPETFTVATPTGGRHLYFTAPSAPLVRNSAGKAGPMIDVRASGGYVVGVGSVVGGVVYRVLGDYPVLPLPAWLAGLIAPNGPSAREVSRERPAAPARRLAGLLATVLEAQPGRRNQTLNWAAFKARELVDDGSAPRVEIEDALRAAALSIGLEPAEIDRTLSSALGSGR